MRKVLIFGGTSDEHILIAKLCEYDIYITLCVATEYGKEFAPQESERLTVMTGRLDSAGIEALLCAGKFIAVIDATHPYAIEVTKNIKSAAHNAGVTYLRLARPRSVYSDSEDVVTAKDAANAAQLLKEMPGNILITTGSKELHIFTEEESIAERVFARVLPTCDSIEKCAAAGVSPKRIIAMQGPFSREMNTAIILQFGIKVIVTKDGGDAGGFSEKLAAARECGARLVLLDRPVDDGLSPNAVLTEISKLLGV